MTGPSGLLVEAFSADFDATGGELIRGACARDDRQPAAALVREEDFDDVASKASGRPTKTTWDRCRESGVRELAVPAVSAGISSGA